MDDFNLFTEQDRQDISYGACVGGATLVGAAVGRFGMLPGLLAGAGVGLAIGLLTCRKLSPSIERKLFSKNQGLTDQELLQVLKIVRDETGAQSKSDAMYLLGYARVAMAKNGESIWGDTKSCQPIRVVANRLLSLRA